MTLALITGASSGIGEALAYLLTSKKIELILSGRDEKRLEKVANEVSAKKKIVADLLTENGRESILKAIREFLPDIVINCAGFGIYGEAINLPVEQQVAILEVNARIPLECTLEAAQTLIGAGKKGVILNVSSLSGDHPSPGMSVYGASKAFVTMFSRALNYELAPKGVDVLVSCPGMVGTNFAKRAGGRSKIRSGPVMSPEFAAKEIWKQIEKRQEKRIFNRYYRISSWFATHFAPVSLVKKIIWRSIQERL